MIKKAKLPELDTLLMFQIYRLSRLLRIHFQQKVDADPDDIRWISQEQIFLLYQLYIRDGQTQRELADKKINDYPNITRMVDKLEKKKFVVRESDENDRRVCIVHLTDLGREFFDTKQAVVETEIERMIIGVSPEEDRVVRKVLAQLEKNLE